MFHVLEIEIPQNDRAYILVGNSPRISGPRQPSMSMTMREARGVTEAGRLILLSSLYDHIPLSLCSNPIPTALVPLSWASSLRFSERLMLPPSSPLESTLGVALQDYTAQTGTKLDGHPITETLKKCDSADSITSVLRDHARAFHEFEGDDGNVMKPIKCAVQVLYTLSTSAVSGEDIDVNLPVCSKSFISISSP